MIKNNGIIQTNHAILLYSIVIVSMIISGQFLFDVDIIYGLVITQIFLVLLPVLIFVRILKIDMNVEFNTSPLRWQMIPITILCALILMYIAGIFTNWFMSFVNASPEYIELMESIPSKLSKYGDLRAVILIALMPAICEELLFRGFILQGIRNGCNSSFSFIDKKYINPDILAVIITGVLFGLFHLDLYRLPATIILGVFLGFIALKGGIYMAILGHFTVNVSTYFLMTYNS